MKWQINEWGAFSMGLNSSFRWKISKKFHLDRNLFRNKKIMWHIMWWKLVSLGLIGIQILKIIFMSNLGKVFESLTKKFKDFQRKSFQRFKIFRRFRVFILCNRANSKRRKWRKESLISVANKWVECYFYGSELVI